MKRFFTLIELIAVIVTLGILVSIIIPNISSIKGNSELVGARTSANSLQKAVDTYQLDNGSLPTNGEIDFGNPQPIDYELIYPENIRNVPDHKTYKYWVDYQGQIWHSTADAPLHLRNEESQLSWNKVNNAVSYNIYEEENRLVGNTEKRNYKFVANVSSNKFSDDKYNPDKVYMVSSIDKDNLESAPASYSYKGYTLNLKKDAKESCLVILESDKGSIDGYYWIEPKESSPFVTYCDMENGGWTRVSNYIYGETIGPKELEDDGGWESTMKDRYDWATGKPPYAWWSKFETEANGEEPQWNSIKLNTEGVEYTDIKIDYKFMSYWSPDGFKNHHGNSYKPNSVEGQYVDGISVTYGKEGDRKHLMTYVWQEKQVGEMPDSIDFIGSDIVYGKNKTDTFHKSVELTSEPIEFRFMLDQHKDDELIGTQKLITWIR